LQIAEMTMAIEPMAISRLRPCQRNARTHSKKQIWRRPALPRIGLAVTCWISSTIFRESGGRTSLEPGTR
jgi:hypothetical protein